MHHAGWRHCSCSEKSLLQSSSNGCHCLNERIKCRLLLRYWGCSAFSFILSKTCLGNHQLMRIDVWYGCVFCCRSGSQPWSFPVEIPGRRIKTGGKRREKCGPLFPLKCTINLPSSWRRSSSWITLKMVVVGTLFLDHSPLSLIIMLCWPILLKFSSERMLDKCLMLLPHFDFGVISSNLRLSFNGVWNLRVAAESFDLRGRSIFVGKNYREDKIPGRHWSLMMSCGLYITCESDVVQLWL